MKKKTRNLIRPVYAIIMSAVLLFVSAVGLGYAWYHVSVKRDKVLYPNDFDAEIYVDGELVSDGTVANIPLHFNSCTYLPDASKSDFSADDFNSVCKVVTVKIRNTGIAIVKTYVEVTPNFEIEDGDSPPVLYAVLEYDWDENGEPVAPTNYFDKITGAFLDWEMIASLSDLTAENQVEILDQYNKTLTDDRAMWLSSYDETVEVFIVFWADFYGLVAQGYEVGSYPEIAPFSFTISAMAVDENFTTEEYVEG